MGQISIQKALHFCLVIHYHRYVFVLVAFLSPSSPDVSYICNLLVRYYAELCSTRFTLGHV